MCLNERIVQPKRKTHKVGIIREIKLNWEMGMEKLFILIAGEFLEVQVLKETDRTYKLKKHESHLSILRKSDMYYYSWGCIYGHDKERMKAVWNGHFYSTIAAAKRDIAQCESRLIK